MGCGSGYAMACGADDCRQCHPENFVGNLYVTSDTDEFELVDDGTLDTVVRGPHGYELRLDTETAADYRDPDTGAMVRWHDLVRDHALHNADYAEWLVSMHEPKQ